MESVPERSVLLPKWNVNRAEIQDRRLNIKRNDCCMLKTKVFALSS